MGWDDRFYDCMFDKFSGFFLLLPFLISNNPNIVSVGFPIISFALFVVSFFLYFILFIFFTNSTPGMRLFRIKVLSLEGARVTLEQVLIRETMGKIISTIPVFFGFIVESFTGKKQGFHDFIAKTVVVYTDFKKNVSVFILRMRHVFYCFHVDACRF